MRKYLLLLALLICAPLRATVYYVANAGSNFALQLGSPARFTGTNVGLIQYAPPGFTSIGGVPTQPMPGVGGVM